MNTLEKSLENISYIEKTDTTTTDFEGSINNCLQSLAPVEIIDNNENTNNNTFKTTSNHKKNSSSRSKKKSILENKVKSILKSSKEKIDEMKINITKIFENSNTLISNLDEIQRKNNNEKRAIFSTSKLIFEEQLNEIYEEKIDKINALNNKYNYDLFKLKDICSESPLKGIEEMIYESVMDDKKKERQIIEREFMMKKNKIKIDFKESTGSLTEFSIDDRSFIYKNELFEFIKDAMNEIISPKKKHVKIMTKLNFIEPY